MKQVKFWDELSPKQRVTRWKHAVRVIENLTEHEIELHFDMGTWGDRTPCGTVGCAAGQCGLDPQIRRQGFKLEFSNDSFHGKFNMRPYNFYGWDAYELIFTDSLLCDLRRGKEAHTTVLAKMKVYLEKLKAYANA